MLPLPLEITSGLKTKKIGKTVYYFNAIDSTQNFATKISNQNNSGTVIIAQRQTSGKGRLGRKWVSPSGGIWLSIILMLPMPHYFQLHHRWHFVWQLKRH
jgi:BirA family biotin operon repressor/biotin-[acetyl-CoA-carboxylase] ligase